MRVVDTKAVLLIVCTGVLSLTLYAQRGAAEDVAPPIAIEACSGSTQSATNPNLKVGISFRNNAKVDAVYVTFDILLMDASDKLVDTQNRSIEGKFSPNALIEPRRSPISEELLTQPEYPDSPAWNVANHFGSGVMRVRCQLHSVRWRDGTVWKRS